MSFDVYVDGRKISARFNQASSCHSLLVKHVFLHLLGEDLAAGTALRYVGGAKHVDEKSTAALLRAGPAGIASLWAELRSLEYPSEAYGFAKGILRLLCKHRLGGWSESYRDLISTLPLPFKDKYAVVRSGEAFLSTDDEAEIIRFLDRVAEGGIDSDFSERELQDAAMLLCAYQFGMRPVQIAKVALRDMRIRQDRSSSAPTVHLSFHMVKQRIASATKPLLRRVKNEWAPILISIHDLAKAKAHDHSQRLFGVRSAHDASLRIATLLRTLLGGDPSASKLRHTAAQRLVDAGASQEELAEFLGHSDITTGLVYYETSANQAELVNNALGISEIYTRVARIAHARYISRDELARLKDTQQLGGVPHGLPISGIGGCTSGQPACPYNPILSCYGCRKFMPVHDLSVHTKVLSDFRSVARHFHDASRGDSVSPTYLQLKRTISEVQAVVDELGSSTS